MAAFITEENFAADLLRNTVTSREFLVIRDHIISVPGVAPGVIGMMPEWLL